MNIQIDTNKKVITLLEPVKAGELYDMLAELAKENVIDYSITFPAHMGTEIIGNAVEYKPEDFISTCKIIKTK